MSIDVVCIRKAIECEFLSFLHWDSNVGSQKRIGLCHAQSVFQNEFSVNHSWGRSRKPCVCPREFPCVRFVWWMWCIS